MFSRLLHTQLPCFSCKRITAGTTCYTQAQVARLHGSLSICQHEERDIQRSDGLSIATASNGKQRQNAKRHGGFSPALNATLHRSVDNLESSDGSTCSVQASSKEGNKNHRDPNTIYRTSRLRPLSVRASAYQSRQKDYIGYQPKECKDDIEHKKTQRSASYDRVEWDTLYTKLSQTHYNQPGKEKHFFKKEYAFANAFVSGLTGEQLRQKWLSLGETQRFSIVPSLLIGSLVKSAHQALFVLMNISPIPKNFYITMLCLRYISVAYQEEVRGSSEVSAAFEATLSKCRNFSNAGDAPTKQIVMDTLLKFSSPEQCEGIIGEFLRCYPYAPAESFIPIIRYYLRNKSVDKALDIFARLPQSSLQRPSTRIASVRNDILKCDSIERSDTGSNFKVLPRLLALGVQPDASLHHIVIENAIASGVPNVAWDVFQYLQSQNLEVDPRLNARTHLVLLRNAFERENTEGVNTILTAILENEALHCNPYLIAYTMNVVRVTSFSNAVKPIEAMSRIMALYDRAYTRNPLLRFQMFDDIGINVRTEALPEPSVAFLSFTIWTFILVQRSEYVVDKLWWRFVKLASYNDDIVRSCLKLDIIYNGFILYYARALRSLTKSLRVVSFMLDSGHCEPTSRTWSLLIYAFLRHGQSRQAKSIIWMMKTKGYTIKSISDYMALHDPAAVGLASSIEAALDDKKLPDTLEEELSSPESLVGLEGCAPDEL